MSYGVDYIEMQSRIAEFVGKILGGAKPADIPVEQQRRSASKSRCRFSCAPTS
jgi:ABC-type uncharacterized transport system substrate-binding protein